MADRNTDILLIGGGIASASAAAELRANGFEGSILLATREQDPPYHRPPVTKDYLQGRVSREQTYVYDADWYDRNEVELLLRAPVMALDPEARTARVGKEQIAFGQALLATGAMVRRLQIPGATLDGIHYLRALGNADKLRDEIGQAGRVTVVGGSYIATEVAASLTALGRPVTMVMQEQLPLERTFGKSVGRLVADELQARGVTLIGDAHVAGFDGTERVEVVLTASGERIPSGVVVVGVGAIADSKLAQNAGFELGNSGGVRCDQMLRTSFPAVFAAGDVCEYSSLLHGTQVRIEHEDLAAAQGRHAARNMLDGAERPFTEVPYFWSDLADWLTLEYVGLGGPWDRADVEAVEHPLRFSVRYTHRGRLTGVCSVGGGADLERARDELAATEQALTR
jgi:3-phenylpropionate/trans-cinnamate dioxygenase ferredoxin reductase subunit